MQVAKQYVDESEEINKKINASYKYFRENIDRFGKCKQAVFDTSLTETDKQFLASKNWPNIECNVLKPYVSRLRGEFSKQLPSINVSTKANAVNDEALNETLEGIIRSVLDDANKNQFQDKVYNDSVCGGFSWFKVYTEYESHNSFNQVIRVKRVFDPTLCFGDPLAQDSHKGDGEYCGEHFPMTKEHVEKMFGVDLSDQNFGRQNDGFNWYYKTQTEKIALVCHFYKKKYKKKKIVLLANGITMPEEDYMAKTHPDVWTHMIPPPKVINERTIKMPTVCRYTLLGGVVKMYEETDFSHFPLIFLDNDSQTLYNESGETYQRTTPFVESAISAQRMKNYTGQAFLNEIAMLMQPKFWMSERSVPEDRQLLQNILRPDQPSVLIYRDFDPDNPQVPVAPPMPVFRQQIPQEIYPAFVGADDVIRSVLSSFNPSEAVSNNDISGLAIEEAATQSNAVAMPGITNYMAAMTHLGCVILDLIPKYYITPRTVPVVDKNGERGFKKINVPGGVQTKYDPSTLGVQVMAAVNFDVQRRQSMDKMISLSQALPVFQQLLAQPGALNVLLDNLDIKGVEKLKDIEKEATENAKKAQAQQGQQPNPQMIAIQMKMKEMEIDQQYKQGQLQNAQAKLQLDAQNQDAQNQIKLLQIQIEQQQLELAKYQAYVQAQLSSTDQAIQVQKARVEQQSHQDDLEMSALDMAHDHAMDVHHSSMDILDRLNEHDKNTLDASKETV